MWEDAKYMLAMAMILIGFMAGLATMTVIRLYQYLFEHELA